MSWTKKRLGDFAPFVYGKGLPREKRVEGNVPVYGSNGIVGFHNQALLTEPVVVIGRKGSVGEIHLTAGPSWPIDTTFYSESNDDVDLDYLFYLLQTLPLKSNSDSAVPGLNRDYAHSLEVFVPEKPMQVRIGSILKSLDLLVSLNSAVSQTLEEIAQAVFKSWFIDFDPVKAKMAGEKPVGMDDATAALFPDSMEDSEFGQIPKNWKSVKLDDELLLLESGKRPKGGAEGDSGVPSIGAESIRGLGIFDFSNTKFIPNDFYDGMPSGKVNEFDVLVYKDGAGAGSYVSMFGCGFPFEKFAINEHVFLLRAKSVSQYFLYFWMEQNKTKNLMIELAQKSAQPGLNQKDMRTIGFLRPETRVVDKFSEIVEPIIIKVMKLANQSRQLSIIRDTLLPRLLSGELQIPEEMLVS
jgi:type I restriction enzyme S subunit